MWIYLQTKAGTISDHFWAQFWFHSVSGFIVQLGIKCCNCTKRPEEEPKESSFTP